MSFQGKWHLLKLFVNNATTFLGSLISTVIIYRFLLLSQNKNNRIQASYVIKILKITFITNKITKLIVKLFYYKSNHSGAFTITKTIQDLLIVTIFLSNIKNDRK
jgi:hypothetical protein